MKEIAVLLAAYEGEVWLPAQLSSLEKQEDPCWFAVLQDDGAKGATREILAEAVARDARFTLGEVQGQGLGAIGNFWSLIRQADAPLYALCDQDDLWHPNRLSRCREAMAQAEALYGEDTPLLVHSDSRVISADGTVLHESFFRHQGWDPQAVTLRRLLVQNNVTGCTVLFNRALRDLALCYGQPERMVMHDWFLALTAAAFGHVSFIDMPLVDYRQHGDNVKGASKRSLTRRGLDALGAVGRSRARVALTYRQTGELLSLFGGALPEAARQDLEGYLQTMSLPKLRRVAAVQAGGYTMQSRVTRAGQIVFG